MPNEYKLNHLIKEAIEKMEQAGNVDAKVDAWLLAEEIFQVNRSQYFMNPEQCMQAEKSQQFCDLVNKRCEKIPLQHLTGKQEFMGYSFKVNENVLIPRQDTELLVENVVAYIKKEYAGRSVKVLDMCTGSGCIAISIKKMLPQADVTAVDLSEKALEVAKENAKNLQADIRFVHSDLFDAISGKYDIIVSNPPYISKSDILTLMEEVREHEPMMALDGDEDGLKFYRKISMQAVKYLEKGGMIFYEIGYDQGKSVPEILQENNFTDIKVYKDLSENDRVVIAKKGENDV